MRILINGDSIELDGVAEVSYAFIVQTAFGGKNDRPARVTFKGSGHDGADGELLPGESVRVVDGTFFNVLPNGSG